MKESGPLGGCVPGARPLGSATELVVLLSIFENGVTTNNFYYYRVVL